MGASEQHTNRLLEIWTAHCLAAGEDGQPPFASQKEMLATIDAIQVGDTPFLPFSVRYTGHLDDNSPDWQRAPLTVYARDTRLVAHNMLQNRQLDGHFHTTPYREFEQNKRVYSDTLSAEWAWNQAVRHESIFATVSLADNICQTTIARDPATHGAMLVPTFMGADKTTVSVATGNTEFHPLYFGLLNTTNEMRRAHRDAIVPIAFLAIPKGECCCGRHGD